MSCRCTGAVATAANVVQVTIAHCSGDVIVFCLDPTKYANVMERVSAYMKLCYVHEPACNFRTFTDS
jgi:hypothetical protein